jgi:regulator of sirC expression with transglutaminase-like and TPR domain
VTGEQNDFLERFEQEAHSPRPDPERLALIIAGAAYPDLDVAYYQRRLDELAAQAAESMEGLPTGRARAIGFLNAVHGRLGFRGDENRYYAPRNSYLNAAIDRRRGLPITLSLVYMALGRRLDLRVEGMGFPGHFMVRYRDGGGVWLLDPFYGKMVDAGQASGYLSGLLDQPINLPDHAFSPVTPIPLTLRMLNNLRNAYIRLDNYSMAAQVMSYLLVLMPTNASFWQERGLLYYQSERWEETVHDLQRYFFLRGQLTNLHQTLEDDAAPSQLSDGDRNLRHIYRQADHMMQRLN